MTKSILIFFTLILTNMLGYSQHISVSSCRYNPYDLSASTNERKDLNGKSCGLLKIHITKDDLSFDGNVIGNVAYKNGEYWVYMTSGSKSLGIKHPDFMPLTVSFSDFNISSIESKGCYEMQLEHERKLKYDRNAFLYVAKKAHDNETFSQEDFEEMIYQYSVFVETYNQWWDDIDEAKEYNDERGLESYRKIAKTQKMVMLWEGAKHMAIELDRAKRNNLLSDDNQKRYNFMDIERRKLHNRISVDGEGLYRY